jgi:hypothetical protein
VNRWSMSRHTLPCLFSLFAAVTVTGAPASAQQQQKPNIVVIMGDDIGMWNIGAYHRGLMAGRTPNLDKIAKEGMLFKATRASLLAGAIASTLWCNRLLVASIQDWLRDHFCRRTMAPRASWSTTCNGFLPISMPITAIPVLGV